MNNGYEFRSKLIIIFTFVFLSPMNAYAAQSCADANTQYIIGGKNAVDDKAPTENNSKCFISEISDVSKSSNVRALKIDKTIKINRDISPVALKINLYDKKTVEDRTFILNNELRKALLLKEELSKKKSNGQSVDELQLSRLDADITALKNELSR